MVNVTGGLKIDEPAADLGIALAIASSFRDASVDQGLTVVGEIGLSGELRAVPQLDRRVAEAARLGFKRILTPKSGGKIDLPHPLPLSVNGEGNSKGKSGKLPKDIEILAFSSLREAVEKGLGA
jgi:DNA repair protein RadA/Sms